MSLSTNQTSTETTMAEPPARKFLFERSFDGLAGSHAVVPERKPVTLKPEQFDALKKESWDAGFAAGQKKVADDEARHMAAILTQVDAKLAGLMSGIHEFYKQMEAELPRAVLAVARKILPDFTARHGLQEIEAVLTNAIAGMLREPRLVVRVHESQFDAVNARINEITAQKAYVGKVVVLADANTAPGDCLVEWADGGIERNTADTWNEIEKAVATDQNQPNQTAGG